MGTNITLFRTTSMKGTVDPEGACLLTLVYAYGKPHLLPVHKYHYAPPCIVLQQATALHALHRQCISEDSVSVSSFKSIT